MSEIKQSKAWWLAPIFLGWLGGLLMWLALKEENKPMAKKGLIVGIVLTVVWSAVYIPVLMLFVFI